VIITRWPQLSHPHLAILCTADDTSLAVTDNLLCCDWLGKIRLIITRAVCRLVIATLGMIGDEAFRAVWLVGKVFRYLSILCLLLHQKQFAFSALTLMVGRQEGHPACKNLSSGVLAWLSAWSDVQTWICPSWCHCHSLSLASVKCRLILPFLYRCVCVCVCVCACVHACVCYIRNNRTL